MPSSKNNTALLPRWEQMALRLLLADSRRAEFVCLSLLLVLMVVMMALTTATGCSHQVFNPWDTAVHLDGGWRLYNGQVPNRDFYSPIEIVPLLVWRLGMWWSGPNVNALATGPLLLFPFVTIWAWIVVKRRFPALVALLIAATCGCMIVGTAPPGTDFRMTGYAMQYNRFGWAFFSILTIQLFLAPRTPLSVWAARCEVGFAGVLWALLVFTKVNYLGMSTVAVGLGFLLVPETRKRLPSLLVGFALFTAILVLVFGLDIPALIGDLRMLSGAGAQKPLRRFLDLWTVIDENLYWIGGLLFCFACLAKPRAADTLLRPLIVAMALLGMSVMICSTNAQAYHIPVFGIAGLLMCEAYRRNTDVFVDSARFLFPSVLACVLLGQILTTDACSVAYSFAWKQYRTRRHITPCRVETSSMKDMQYSASKGERGLSPAAIDRTILERTTRSLDDNPPDLTAAQYARWINDGVDLLRKHLRPESRIFVLDIENPFSFTLQVPPPNGDALYWQPGRIVDAIHCPPSERVFHEVTLVMLPKSPLAAYATRFLTKQFVTILERDYEKVDESSLWILLAKRKD